jgi:hypothetical protein
MLTKLLGFISIFVGGVLLFSTKDDTDNKIFIVKIIFGPLLLFLGFKALVS